MDWMFELLISGIIQVRPQKARVPEDGRYGSTRTWILTLMGQSLASEDTARMCKKRRVCSLLVCIYTSAHHNNTHIVENIITFYLRLGTAIAVKMTCLHPMNIVSSNTTRQRMNRIQPTTMEQKEW